MKEGGDLLKKEHGLYRNSLKQAAGYGISVGETENRQMIRAILRGW